MHWILTLILFGTPLIPRQYLYLMKQVDPNLHVLVVVTPSRSKDSFYQEAITSGISYKIKVEGLEVKRLQDLASGLKTIFSESNPKAMLISQGKYMEDPMLLRFMVETAISKKIPLYATSEKQVRYGATFYFSLNEEQKVTLLYHPTTLKNSQLTLPQKEDWILIPFEAK